MTFVSQIAPPVASRTVPVSCLSLRMMALTSSMTAAALSRLIAATSSNVRRCRSVERRSMRPGSPIISTTSSSNSIVGNRNVGFSTCRLGSANCIAAATSTASAIGQRGSPRTASVASSPST